jgi:hypothetical protein
VQFSQILFRSMLFAIIFSFSSLLTWVIFLIYFIVVGTFLATCFARLFLFWFCKP